ncbi:hypothetical protein BGX28_004072 [Mortierella sp. GBA30]|nr:hypothetical protein BGX28_004072 [Mortierella sp. GBA30]
MEIHSPSPSSAIPRPQSPKLHALDLVELRSLIVQFLTKQDLAKCILISKQWSQYFLPLYWHTVNISPHRLARCQQTALFKHGHHVRILSAGRIEVSSVFNQSSVAHLTKIDVSTCGSKDREDGGRGCLQEIIQRNSESLVTLCWRCYGRDTHLDNRPFRLWVNMFQDLRHLTTIELSNWAMSKLDFLRILVACPDLRHLKLEAVEGTLDFGGRNLTSSQKGNLVRNNASGKNGSGSDSHQRSEESALYEFKHTILESIEFVGNVIPSFLQHVPNITHLSLTHMLHGDFDNLHEYAQRGNCCQKITHLTMMTTCSVPTKFLALIQTIPSPGTLVSFEGLVPLWIVDDFLETILQRHSGTIENLILRDKASSVYFQQQTTGGEFRFNIWRIFETCPSLLVLEIPYSLQECAAFQLVSAISTTATSSQGSVSILETNPFSSSEDLILKLYEPTGEWVCKDLKRLMLMIKDMDEAKPMDQITFDLCVDRLLPPEEKRDNTKRTRSALERMILERLSGLSKLEMLHIGGGWYTLPKRKF